jgi:hypothetical protein
VSPAAEKKQPAENNIDKDDVNETPLDNYFSLTDDREMLDCFKCLPDEEWYLNLPEDRIDHNPLDMENIKEQQDTYDALLQHATKYADQYTHKRIGTIDDILHYVKPGDHPKSLKKLLPKSLLQPTIKWFHQVTGHPGRKRPYMQISSWYYHRDICLLIAKFYCKHCQRNKLSLSGTGYGLLPECKLRSVPFKIIQVHNKLYGFNALTAIDTVSNLVGLVRIDEKSWHTWQENTPKSGYQDTLCQNIVLTIMVEKF